MSGPAGNGRDELPQGWAWATLGDLGRYHNGRGFKKSEWRAAGRPIIRIQNLTDSTKPFNYFDGEADPRNEVRDGDLLVSWAATLDAFQWRGPDAVLNQHIFKVESFISPAFHYHLLKAVLADLRAQAHGSGMVHITRGRFLATPVRVPPLQEQVRIAAAVEELDRLMNDAVESLSNARAHARLLGESIYTNALCGAWPKVELGDLLREPLRNGHSAKASSDGAGVRTLTLTAVTTGRFNNRNTKMTTADPARVSDLWIEPGDLFVERSNTPELVGTAALYAGDPGWAIFPDLLIRVRASDAVLPEFVELVLKERRARRYFRQAAQGIAGSMPKISQETIRAFPIPLPELDEQHRIVSFVRRQVAARNQSMDDIDRGKEIACSLRRAMLEAAISGGLTAQDPSDQPAAALLKDHVGAP